MIVCLCGSMRFADQFTQAEQELSARGLEVLTVDRSGETDRSLLMLRHLDKIARADAVLVLGGHVGLDTRLELKWASIRGKPVVWRDACTSWERTAVAVSDAAGKAHGDRR